MRVGGRSSLKYYFMFRRLHFSFTCARPWMIETGRNVFHKENDAYIVLLKNIYHMAVTANSLVLLSTVQ